MKKYIFKTLAGLSCAMLIACSNESNKAVTTEEAQQNFEIFNQVSISFRFTEEVNKLLNYNPDLAYFVTAKNNVYTQIAKGCIATGAMNFTEIAPKLYKLEITEKLKECIRDESKKPIGYQILAESYLNILNHDEKPSIQSKLKVIYDEADKKQVFTVSDYINVLSIVEHDMQKPCTKDICNIDKKSSK